MFLTPLPHLGVADVASPCGLSNVNLHWWGRQLTQVALEIPLAGLDALLHALHRRRADGALSSEFAIATDCALNVLVCPCCTLHPSKPVEDVITTASGKLALARPLSPDPLQGAATSAINGEAGATASFRLPTSTEGVWLYGSVRQFTFNAVMLLLFSFVHPADRNLPRSEALVEWFGLSPTEASLAIELANGADVAAIAERRRLSTLTVRTHLRTIFEKTNTHKQQDLVALLVRLAAL